MLRGSQRPKPSCSKRTADGTRCRPIEPDPLRFVSPALFAFIARNLSNVSRAEIHVRCAPSIYRTTAPITSTNRDASPLHKEQALSCHCLPLSAGGECLRERVLRGVAVKQLDSTPRQHQRHFTCGRVISAAFLFGQTAFVFDQNHSRHTRTTTALHRTSTPSRTFAPGGIPHNQLPRTV